MGSFGFEDSNIFNNKINNYKAENDYLDLMKMSGYVSKVVKKRLRTPFDGKYSENVLKTIAEKINDKKSIQDLPVNECINMKLRLPHRLASPLRS